MNSKVEAGLNEQIQKEEYSSRLYLSMASWCEVNGFPGVAEFLYGHSDEERIHMLKLVRFVNDRGGKTKLLKVEVPPVDYDSVLDIFKHIRDHEVFITESINKLYAMTMEEHDYTTGNFLQWYINEQIEEESLFNKVLDKIELAGADKAGMFHIDKELEGMATPPSIPGK
jgi:ferritin